MLNLYAALQKICLPIKDISNSSYWICNSCELSWIGNFPKSNFSSMMMVKIDVILTTLNEIRATIFNHENSLVSLKIKFDNISSQIIFLLNENKLINNRLNDLELKMSKFNLLRLLYLR